MRYQSVGELYADIEFENDVYAGAIVDELKLLANRYVNFSWRDLRYMSVVQTQEGPYWRTVPPQIDSGKPVLPAIMQAIENNPTGVIFCRVDPAQRYRIIRVIDEAKFSEFLSEHPVNYESFLPYIFVDPITNQTTKYGLVCLPKRVPSRYQIEEVPDGLGFVFERESALSPLPGGKYCRMRQKDVGWFARQALQTLNSDWVFAMFGAKPDDSPKHATAKEASPTAKADAAVVRSLARLPYIRTRDDFRRALQALYTELKDIGLNKLQAKPYLQRFMDAAEACDLPRQVLEEEMLWLIGADKDAMRIRRVGNAIRGLEAATEIDIETAQKIELSDAIIDGWVHQGVFVVLGPRSSLYVPILSETIARSVIYGTPLFGQQEVVSPIPGRVCVIYPDVPHNTLLKAAQRINDKNFYFKMMPPLGTLTESDQKAIMDILSGDTSVIILRMSWDYISSVSRAMTWLRPMAELQKKLIIIESTALEKMSSVKHRHNWVQYAEFMYSGVTQNLMKWTFADTYESTIYVTHDSRQIILKRLAPNDLGVSLLEPFMALAFNLTCAPTGPQSEVSLQLLKDILGYNSPMTTTALRLGRLDGLLKKTRGDVIKLTQRGRDYGREMWEHYHEMLMPMISRYHAFGITPNRTFKGDMQDDEDES